MEIDRASGPWTQVFWGTSALLQARHSRRPLLRGAQWLRLAHAPARSAAVADRLLLFHGLAPRGNLAENSRHAARRNQTAERKKKAPTAAILDSQSVKVSNHGGGRGY